jgi:uncharacterized protein (TIGR02996 family)
VATADAGETLLDAVYESPDDVSLRLVYADWLQERGDPRGEFIVTQVRTPRTPEQEAREAELLEQHGEEWQGRLGEITTWAEFELGFLARCGLRRFPKWVIGRREWATVKHVGVADDWTDLIAPLVGHAAMKSLVSLRVAARTLDKILGSTARTRLRTLAVDGSIAVETLIALGKTPVFGSLAELDVKGGIGDWRMIFDDPLVFRFAAIAFEVARWHFVCRRGDDGWLSMMQVRAQRERWGRESELGDLTKFFEQLPADILTALDLVLPKTKMSGLPGLKRAIARQKRVAPGL